MQSNFFKLAGSQTLVSLVLRKELPSDSFSMVAEEVHALNLLNLTILWFYLQQLIEGYGDWLFIWLLFQDSGDLRKDSGQETLKRITKLVNDTLSADGTYNFSVSEDDVLDAIDTGKSEGGPYGRHWVLDPIDGTKG